MLQALFLGLASAQPNLPLMPGQAILVQHYLFCSLGTPPERIAADGTVRVSDLGQVHVAGLTIHEAEVKLGILFAETFHSKSPTPVSIMRIRFIRASVDGPRGFLAYDDVLLRDGDRVTFGKGGG